MRLAATQPQRDGELEQFAVRLVKIYLAVEGGDSALEILARGVAGPVDYRASSVAVSTEIANPADFQVFDSALLTHDFGKCFHPGAILSGVTKCFNFFLAGPPVSFQLTRFVGL